MVVGHEGVELQGVELEAGVMDVWNILHGVFVHGQQGGGLEDTHRSSTLASCIVYVSQNARVQLAAVHFGLTSKL